VAYRRDTRRQMCAPVSSPVAGRPGRGGGVGPGGLPDAFPAAAPPDTRRHASRGFRGEDPVRRVMVFSWLS